MTYLTLMEISRWIFVWLVILLISEVMAVEILSKQSQFTRRGLQRRDDWTEWKAAENKMLEQMLKYKMFLSHITLWKDMPADADVIRAIWSCCEKMFTNRKKARLCGNSKPLKPKKKMFHEPHTAMGHEFSSLSESYHIRFAIQPNHTKIHPTM